MNDNFSQNIIKQIDKGIPIYDIAEYFGGLDKFRKLILKYPYLVALVETKLGGYISIEVDGEEYETYEIPFILIHFSETDFDEQLYNASVDIQIPEITNKGEPYSSVNFFTGTPSNWETGENSVLVPNLFMLPVFNFWINGRSYDNFDIISNLMFYNFLVVNF